MLIRSPIHLAFLALLACSDFGGAASADPLAISDQATRTDLVLNVTSPAFADGGAIPLRHSAYGDGLSPPIGWSAPPQGTRSFVLMLEDPDAMSARPFVHWLVWNIPSEARSLPEGRASEASRPGDAVEGRNSRGSIGYFGPRPHGKKAHHYHLQIFALDTVLALRPGARRAELLAAMEEHVLAKGQLIGLFRQPR
jgi:Raf kinase inhibitor-like YbhB/YbcL family protein